MFLEVLLIAYPAPVFTISFFLSWNYDTMSYVCVCNICVCICVFIVAKCSVGLYSISGLLFWVRDIYRRRGAVGRSLRCEWIISFNFDFTDIKFKNILYVCIFIIKIKYMYNIRKYILWGRWRCFICPEGGDLFWFYRYVN